MAKSESSSSLICRASAYLETITSIAYPSFQFRAVLRCSLITRRIRFLLTAVPTLPGTIKAKRVGLSHLAKTTERTSPSILLPNLFRRSNSRFFRMNRFLGKENFLIRSPLRRDHNSDPLSPLSPAPCKYTFTGARPHTSAKPVSSASSNPAWLICSFHILSFFKFFQFNNFFSFFK